MTPSHRLASLLNLLSGLIALHNHPQPRTRSLARPRARSVHTHSRARECLGVFSWKRSVFFLRTSIANSPPNCFGPFEIHSSRRSYLPPFFFTFRKKISALGKEKKRIVWNFYSTSCTGDEYRCSHREYLSPVLLSFSRERCLNRFQSSCLRRLEFTRK